MYPYQLDSFRPVLRYTLEGQDLPGRRWSGEEKANIVLETLTTSTTTAEYPGGATFDQPWSTAGKQVSFKQVQEVCLVQMHRIEKSGWNRKIRDSRKW